MSKTLVIPALAKLNLALAVAPPEQDALPDGKPNLRAGWHRISSIFTCITLADELALTPLPAGPSRFSIRWAPDAPAPSPIDWPIEKDLAFRAHALLEAHIGRPLPVEVVLTKRIPVGGGMGGGSSNAAAMLLGLASLFEIDPTALPALGARLGSDVPFFLDLERPPREAARPALVQGFGERIERRSAFSSSVVLICPRLPCPTPAVYRAFDRQLREMHAFRFRETEIRSIFDSGQSLDSRALFNDLAAPAFEVAPALRDLHARASQVHTPVHVTGSGSTLFALADSKDAPSLTESLRRQLSAESAVLTASLI
ncbi:MAG: hypothetical protein KF691_15820 [Phycisphaeraceae bacterium]|nr:hypothetical protein [Phycisphaeraceae bacterium]